MLMFVSRVILKGVGLEFCREYSQAWPSSPNTSQSNMDSANNLINSQHLIIPDNEPVYVLFVFRCLVVGGPRAEKAVVARRSEGRRGGGHVREARRWGM